MNKTIFLLVSFVLLSCTQKQTPELEKKSSPAPAVEKTQNAQAKKEDQELHTEALDYFKPLPDSLIDVEKNAKLIALGKKLYFENKLSLNDTISCNSCHKLDQFGVDHNPTSPGHDGTKGGRNSPTVYNAALHFAQFWDGRAKDVEDQATKPILNPIEHGFNDADKAFAKINNSEYQKLFIEAFNGDKKAFKFENIGVAIGAFERTLLTPSRFDDYLKGDLNALSEKEKKGLRKFINIGCTACHDGVGIGGGQFQMLGAVEEYPTKDLGRFDITKEEDDKFLFKVPGLRNIAETGPYLHDGSISSLDEMIKIMGKHQLGEDIKQEDIDLIKSFLRSLTAKELPRL
ncbi:MAG: c-type cytochrome [Halobacteriovoraceae bacterium]|nr:c-type cytochrome [Halobacteriovoraceae bacterium]